MAVTAMVLSSPMKARLWLSRSSLFGRLAPDALLSALCLASGTSMLPTPAELEERLKPVSIGTSILATLAELEERLIHVSIGTSILATPVELEEGL